MARARMLQVLAPRRAALAALSCVALLAASLPFGHGVAGAAASDVEVERLAGPDRYETAAAIAARYFVESAIAGSVIVASGADRHATCALSAAPLASLERAPLLLTEPGRLPRASARFLAAADLVDVFIVGGSDAVSTTVARQIEELTGAQPFRLGGSDCAATALEVARHLGSAGVAAGRGRTVLLATGSAAADGLSAGPLAYEGRFPMLFTDGEDLDSGLAEYLARRADHVIILGGTAAVSERIEEQVGRHVESTERWAGEDRYATASRIALELLGADSPAPCFDGDGVGLATGFGAADAIASAPLLGERCDPLLLTEPRWLSDATALLLASDALPGDADGRLGLTVFGGTAAVSADAEAEAVFAASLGGHDYGEPVATLVSAAEGACHWRVDFSEPVRTADARRIDNYSLDGAALPGHVAEVVVAEGPATSWAVILLAGSSPYDAASVPIGCETQVEVRDRLGVNAGTIRSAGSGGYNEGAELIVRADTGRPRLTVLAALGGGTIWVRSDEALAEGTVTVTLQRGRSRLTETASVERGDTGFRVTFGFPAHDSYAPATLPFTQPPWLNSGDEISFPASRLRDRAGNASPAVTHTIAADLTPPRVAIASLSQPAHRADGSIAVDLTVRWAEPVQGCGLGPADHSIDLAGLQIDIDNDGLADYALDGTGAAGTGVSFIDAPDANPWTRAGTAACDQSWRESDGALVARLAASSPAVLPRPGSSLIVEASAAYDFAGNPARRHVASFGFADPFTG